MKEVLLLLVIIAIVKCKPLNSKCSRKEVKFKDSRATQCINDSSCPTWFTCNIHNNCQCGNEHYGIIACDDKKWKSAILDCHCATYDEDTRSTFAGSCFYNCENHHSRTKNDLVYYPLPKKADMLSNKSVCTYFNRKGLLCGDCEDGHSPLVLSYNLSCVECPAGHKNWWKFILVAFVPLTFFYLFIVLFNINVTSSRLHGVVFFSQAVSIPLFTRVILNAIVQTHHPFVKWVKLLLVFYSFWNLELFRSILPDICLNVTTLQALALEYVIALYPFLLIVMSYFAIELYDRNIVCIVAMWKPFHKLLQFFRKSWDIRTSVIDSFSTFILLSYIKILSVSTDVLVPTHIYQLNSNRSKLGVFYSPKFVYFGKQHLPYAIFAVVILTFFVCIPTLILLLYPFRFFHKFLSLFPINWHFLHAFVDSFQGSYKDGTEPGTFDSRWFSAVTLLIRAICFVIYGITLSVMYFLYATIIMTMYLIAMINIQPFKKVAYPLTELFFLIFFSLMYSVIIGRSISGTEHNIYYAAMTLLVLIALIAPLVYISFLICSWLLRRQWIITLVRRFKH